MATKEITSLVCDLHDGDEVAGAVPVWFGLGGQLYQIDACPGCAARLRDALAEFLTRARPAGAVPDWMPRPDATAGRAVMTPTPKRDLILSVLRQRIGDGTYPPESYLPTQRDLAAEHGMSVTPVQSACWQLEHDGMLRPRGQGPLYHRSSSVRTSGSGQAAPEQPAMTNPEPPTETASAAPPGSGHIMARGQAEAVTAILTGLREQAGSRAAEAGDLTAMTPAMGWPVCGCQPLRAHPVLPAGPATRLVAWLADNYHRHGLRVGEIAAAVGVSVRQLQHICRRDFGRTPMQLLADIRLHRARLALTGPGAAPDSIAEAALGRASSGCHGSPAPTSAATGQPRPSQPG